MKIVSGDDLRLLLLAGFEGERKWTTRMMKIIWWTEKIFFFRHFVHMVCTYTYSSRWAICFWRTPLTTPLYLGIIIYADVTHEAFCSYESKDGIGSEEIHGQIFGWCPFFSHDVFPMLLRRNARNAPNGIRIFLQLLSSTLRSACFTARNTVSTVTKITEEESFESETVRMKLS